MHYAALRGAPVEVVRALLDAYPEGAGMTDIIYRSLPLHFAAAPHRGRAPVEVVRALLDAYPEGVR